MRRNTKNDPAELDSERDLETSPDSEVDEKSESRKAAEAFVEMILSRPEPTEAEKQKLQEEVAKIEKETKRKIASGEIDPKAIQRRFNEFFPRTV